MRVLISPSNVVIKRILGAAVMILLVLLIGTVGFHFIEGWPLLESAYVATQTVTTVGYGDVTPQTEIGRAFSLVFMLLGVGTVLYGLTQIASYVIQSGIVDALGHRRRIREMDRLNDHYIVCGAGRVGR